MNRNSFIKRSVAAGMGLCVLPGDLFIPAIKGTRAASAVTSGPKHHFFGYYGISPWNKSERSMLCLEVNQQDAMPVKGETAKIVLIDTISNKLHTIAETKAWNYQQGAMMHWNPLNPEDEIYFNDNIDHQIVTRKYNIQSGNEQILTRPVNGLSHNGKYALSLDFGRLGRLRGVVGYSGIEDLSANDPAPENGGIWLMNMQTGESKLIVNYRQVYDLLENRGAKLNGAHLWFNHVVFNKSDNRFFFLARTRKPWETGMFTANLDGSDLFEAIPYGNGVSHFDWQDDKNIVATFIDRSQGHKSKSHYLFTDGEQKYKLLGEGNLNFDGHCVFDPHGEWIATDHKTTVDGQYFQSLNIYNVKTEVLKTLFTHNLNEKMFYKGDLRVDFHPRWNHSGDIICFDSIDQQDGTRQLHIAELNF